MVEEEKSGDSGFNKITAEQALLLGYRRSSASLRQVLLWQVLVGFGVTLLVWLFTGVRAATLSAAYGVACVVVPAGVLVWGLSRRRIEGLPGAMLASFFMWEAVKLLTTVCMLFAAALWFAQVDWLFLLLGFVVTMKAYWACLCPLPWNLSKKIGNG